MSRSTKRCLVARVAIIGAGVMGLAAAYEAARQGHRVELFEADTRPGGMAAHFDFRGLSLERFFHFMCKDDHTTVELLRDLGIDHLLRWRHTTMGYFVGGRHYRWGDPIALLRFPLLGLVDKLRYGLHVFLATKRRRPGDLEHRTTREWIETAAGKRVYDMLWRRLYELKFFEYADGISAAWTWTRIRRVGRSRRSLMKEELGYLDGGSERLVTALADAIVAKGGTVRLGTPVREIVVEADRVTGVRTDEGIRVADAVISTVPLPIAARIVPERLRQRYLDIKTIGVVCVVLKLAKPVTGHFWLNINDPDMMLPGLIELSNLRPLDRGVVYAPYYMPVTNPRFGLSDAALVAETIGYVRRLNPDISEADILDSFVGRLAHAQAVCQPGFASTLPPIQTEIAGLQVADTCFYYPEDRSISESLNLGRRMARNVAP